MNNQVNQAMHDENEYEPELDAHATSVVEEINAEGAAPAPDMQAALDAVLQSKDEEIQALKDQHLRALAETENLRRRFEREQSDMSKYAITGFARDLVDVLENLRRAVDAVPVQARSEHTMLDTIAVGVEMTLKSMAQAFEKHHIIRVEPEIGEKFDHNLHQAISQAASDEVAPGSVLAVMQAGYKIHDRLLRPAMVVVASKPAPAGDAEQGGQVDTSA